MLPRKIRRELARESKTEFKPKFNKLHASGMNRAQRRAYVSRARRAS